VVFLQHLEAFHLQDFTSQCGERLWLQLACLTVATGNLTFTTDIWEGEAGEGDFHCALQKVGLQDFYYFFIPCFQNVAEVLKGGINVK